MANKTLIVDPNSVNFNDSSLNVPVPLEDLTISVQLETEKKARTVLTASKEGGSAQSTGSVKFRVIEGEKINSEHTLTTNFTDLTTVFDTDTQAQSIGITSIDVDFNSSFAPLITINFVDLRGSAIFQNEQNLSGDNSKNKYSVFFELPYPIFTLTIKGYYGKPVSYCLHMTKWNSRFNSQTGNFEITANFIGYTYAMLSDMLLGYLKAIAFTDEGKRIYAAINEERAKSEKPLKPIFTLSELQITISQINTFIEKLAANDPNTVVIQTSNAKSDILNTIQTIVTSLGRDLDAKNGKEESDKEYYGYVVVNHVTNNNETSEVKSTNANPNNIAVASSTFVDNTAALSRISSVNTTNGVVATPEQTYKTAIDENILAYNSSGQPTIDGIMFDITKVSYKDITIDELNPENEDVNLDKLAAKLKMNSGTNEFAKKREEIYNYIQSNYPDLAPTQSLDIYDLTGIYSYIEEERKELEDSIEESTQKLAEEIKNKISSELGFEPSVRQMVEIFTTAVEVFLEVLYNVSVEAEKDSSRAKELKSAFPKNDNTDIVGVDSNATTYYAWPDYREYDQKNGYTEKYLGAAKMKNPKNVTEIRFIDNLLKAFIEANKAEAAAAQNLADKQSNWIPSNPLDTRVFVNTSPYNRMKCTTVNDVLTLMLIRAMTFLGYTNYTDTSLSGEQIATFAKAEANAIINSIGKDKVLIKALKNVSPENMFYATNKINGTEKAILTYKAAESDLPERYTYTYIFDSLNSESYHILPISSDFKGTWEKTLTNDKGSGVNPTDIATYQLQLQETIDGDFTGLRPRGENNIFLSNYSSIKLLNNSKRPNKVYDGGTYIKFLSVGDYDINSYQLIEEIDTTNVISLTELKKVDINLQSAGFNPFGGKYGIQEFSNLNWGDDSIQLPLKYVFFDGFQSDYKIFNGLGRDRSVSGPDEKNNYKTSKYDLTYSTGLKRLTLEEITKDEILNIVNTDAEKILHKDFGKNTVLFKDMIGGDKTITYPYVNQRLLPECGNFDTIDDPDDLYTFSLFGSLLYYAQDKSQYPEHAKALLFLNTLPWNGRGFEKAEIINLFKHRASFIYLPRLWCAYIGGLMWRYDVSGPDPIQWVSGQTAGQDGGLFGQFTYIPTNTTRTSSNATGTSAIPRKDTFFDVLLGSCGPSIYTAFGEEDDNSHLIYALPQQIRDEFKKIFFDFVEGKSNFISWRQIASELEIWEGSSDAFKTFMDTLRASEQKTSDGTFINTNQLYSSLSNIENYSLITPIKNNVTYGGGSNSNITNNFKYCLFLELKGNYTNNQAVANIINAIDETLVMANANPDVWGKGVRQNGDDIENVYEEITATKDGLTLYFSTISEVLAASEVGELEELKQQEQEIFGTTDENIIKLMLYRTCKNINDKWLAGVTEKDKIMFQCGARNSLDTNLRNRYRGENSTLRLIDSFRFVNRSFKDIGDILYVNPLPINDYMVNNPNSSFYDIVSSFLGDNNFDFIALPTFINFRNETELKNVFKPYPDYEEALSNMDAGPSFVCVYVGQKSKHLDLGKSNYSNDGFDFVGPDGQRSPTIPNDFNSDLVDYENTVPVFSVNYSQQNQNLFKDIVLDQSEFSETEESLQITDSLASNGSNNNRSFGGQNMYNVYAVRSYKAEVEMMGNALIQPMMYFQLNNIPMFHGAYLITRVKHSIKPNFMSTHFTGVRVRGPETPLFTAVDLYQNLLSSIDLSISSGGGGTGTGLGSNSYANASSFSSFNSTIIPDVSITGNKDKSFIDPVGNAVVTSFVNRGGRELHEGIDIGIPVGTDAFAIADGEIELIQHENGYGLFLVINHGVLGDEKKVYKSVYGHMSYIPANILNLGGRDTTNLTNADIDQLRSKKFNPKIKVKKGDKVGKTGGDKGKGIYLDPLTKKYNTAGLSSGPHLHFELRVGDESVLNSRYKSIKFVDPLLYIPLGQNPKYVHEVVNTTQTDPANVLRLPTPTNETRTKLFDTLKTWT